MIFHYLCEAVLCAFVAFHAMPRLLVQIFYVLPTAYREVGYNQLYPQCIRTIVKDCVQLVVVVVLVYAGVYMVLPELAARLLTGNIACVFWLLGYLHTCYLLLFAPKKRKKIYKKEVDPFRRSNVVNLEKYPDLSSR